MRKDEFKTIREHLKLDRKQMAELLGLSGYMAVSNIEIGARNPSKLAIKLLRYLDSLPRNGSRKLVEELNRFQSS